MYQIKNLIIDLDEIEAIRKTHDGLEFHFGNPVAILIARKAKFSDIVNAVDIEVLQNRAARIKNECGFKVSY